MIGMTLEEWEAIIDDMLDEHDVSPELKRRIKLETKAMFLKQRKEVAALAALPTDEMVKALAKRAEEMENVEEAIKEVEELIKQMEKFN